MMQALKRRVTQGDSRARLQEVLTTIKALPKNQISHSLSPLGMDVP